jgi:hypothetical protein
VQPANQSGAAIRQFLRGTSRWRVRRLLSLNAWGSDELPPVARHWHRWSMLLTVVLAAGGYGAALHAVHSILEVLVRTLP